MDEAQYMKYLKVSGSGATVVLEIDNGARCFSMARRMSIYIAMLAQAAISLVSASWPAITFGILMSTSFGEAQEIGIRVDLRSA